MSWYMACNMRSNKSSYGLKKKHVSKNNDGVKQRWKSMNMDGKIYKTIGNQVLSQWNRVYRVSVLVLC